MIFAALLESGTGAVHAFNERIASTLRADGSDFGRGRRLVVSLVILTVAVFLAEKIGLVGLIARGYTFLAYAFWAVYVLPVFTLGLAYLWRTRGQSA
jgi:uncharacterized membrane protein YkvI